MLIVNLNFEYGFFGTHTFTNLISLFAPSFQLACLPQDDFMKQCDDQ
jgi:hypothetical protein